jgi:hypothetical protein
MMQASAQDAPSSASNPSEATLREHLLEWAHGQLSTTQVLELHPGITLDGMRIYARGSHSQAKIKRDPETYSNAVRWIT